MSHSISTLLTRNLHHVFGENDPVRRRAALNEIFTEDCVFYEPGGVHRRRDEIDRVAGAIKATHPDLRYQPIVKPEEVGDGGRVQWVSGRLGEVPAYVGTDFTITREGRIAAGDLFSTSCLQRATVRVTSTMRRLIINMHVDITLPSLTKHNFKQGAEMSTTLNTVAIPADDPSRNLVVANPDDSSAPHLGVVGDTYTILLFGTDTAGRFTLIDMHVPPGGGPPPHRHDFEETFILLDGELEATFRGEKHIVHSGETIHIPANAPHQFHNASSQAVRMLCICSPAGQEEFFKEIGTVVATRTAPPPQLDAAALVPMFFKKSNGTGSEVPHRITQGSLGLFRRVRSLNIVATSHLSKSWATNSGPLSERMCFAVPRDHRVSQHFDHVPAV